MNLLQDILVYMRRILKTPSNSTITDDLLIDYINRFWLMDVSAEMQLFDLKKTYQFQTAPGVDRYNMPMYDIQIQPGAQNIAPYPVYQGFTGNCRINGVPVSFHTRKEEFYGIWSNYMQQTVAVSVGDNTVGPYQIQLPFAPATTTTVNQVPSGIIRGHIDMQGIIATGINPIMDPLVVTELNLDVPVTSVSPAVYITSTDVNGNNVVVCDSGQFLQDNVNYGLLMVPGNAPLGNTALNGGYSTTLNTISYFTGSANVTFPVAIPNGQNIYVQCVYYNPGLPRSILFYNNVITLRSPPARQYLVEMDAYMTPAAYLNTGDAIAFGYMSEYIARGAARKILADTGDVEQFMFYEPLFKEQRELVWKRSQRQFTATRTPTIYSSGHGGSWMGNYYNGGNF